MGWFIFILTASLAHAIEGESARPLKPGDNGLTCAEQEMQRRTVRLMGIEDTPCSAVIIDAKTILTAAHCLPNRNSDDKVTSTNVNDAGLTSIRRYDPLSGKYIHIPFGNQGIRYRYKRFANDIAMITLDDSLPGVTPIKRAVPTKTYNEGRQGKIYAPGFGTRGEDLKYHELQPIDVKDQLFKRFKQALPASKDGTRSQVGDSGGPLFRVRGDCNVELYGIATNLNTIGRVGTRDITSHIFSPADLRKLQSPDEAGGSR